MTHPIATGEPRQGDPHQTGAREQRAQARQPARDDEHPRLLRRGSDPLERRIDQHQSVDAIRMPRGVAKHDQAAERVADEHGLASAPGGAEHDVQLVEERSIRRVFPEAVVAPYLVVVATDARHYAALSANVFRFLPLRLTQSDLERMHGKNERIGIDDYEAAVRTYRELLLQAAGR